MYERADVPIEDRRMEVVEHRTPMVSAVLRTLLTILGAAGLVIGAFMEWYRPTAISGINLDWRVFYRPSILGATTDIWRSAGGIMILIAALALLGLSLRSGWITRIAGVLGVAGFALMLTTIYRAGGGVTSAIGTGLWVVLAGSVICVIGGFSTGMRTVVASGSSTTAATRTTGPVNAVPADRSMLQTDHECHVVRNRNGGWDVVGPGRAAPVESFSSKEQAVSRARDLLARDGGGQLVMHGRRGRVRGNETITAA